MDAVRSDILTGMLFKTFRGEDAAKAAAKKDMDEKLPAFLEKLEKMVKGENTFLGMIHNVYCY